jgi:hypothetical protein
MSAKACKELIDNGGAVQSLAESLSTTSKTQATSLAMFGVVGTPKGAEWLAKAKEFQKKAQNTLKKLNEEAMELCMSQPIE